MTLTNVTLKHSFNGHLLTRTVDLPDPYIVQYRSSDNFYLTNYLEFMSTPTALTFPHAITVTDPSERYIGVKMTTQQQYLTRLSEPSNYKIVINGKRSYANNTDVSASCYTHLDITAQDKVTNIKAGVFNFNKTQFSGSIFNGAVSSLSYEPDSTYYVTMMTPASMYKKLPEHVVSAWSNWSATPNPIEHKFVFDTKFPTISAYTNNTLGMTAEWKLWRNYGYDPAAWAVTSLNSVALSSDYPNSDWISMYKIEAASFSSFNDTVTW